MVVSRDISIIVPSPPESGTFPPQKPPTNFRHYALATTPVIPAYELKTIFVLRKYAILLDLPVLLFFTFPRMLSTMVWGDEAGTWGLMVASPGMYFTARGAFEKHASQVVWDR